jgi:tetratricopeptide (TPR) repeat protein
LLKFLAYTYFLQDKLEAANETYEKVHKKNPADEEVIEMLSEITYDLKDYKNAITYLTQYLKFKPRDVNKMSMRAISFEMLEDYKNAIFMHKKILELQPYNTFSRDKVRELGDLVKE